MNLLQSEMLELADKANTPAEKINILRRYDNEAVRYLLRLNFDPNFNFNLPEGEPPFKKDTDKPIGYQETNLLLEMRRFYIWLDPNINLSRVRKERLFIEMLEGLHVTEAEALCYAKDKILTNKFRSLTEDIIREAYPTLLPPKAVVQEEEKPKGKKKALSA